MKFKYLLPIFFLFACTDSSTDLISTAKTEDYNKSISEINIQFVQESHSPTLLTYEDTIFTDISPTLSKTMAKGSSVKVTDTLYIIGTIPPPIVGNDTLQATDIFILEKGNKTAYISYNLKGDKFLGAVQIVDITGNGKKASVDQTIIYKDRDINSLTADGKYIYIAGATENELFTSPAFVEVIQLNNKGIIDTNYTSSSDKEAYRLIDLPSFAATGVTLVDNDLYVTVGADGGEVISISKVESNLSNGYHTLSEYTNKTETSFDDARYIAFEKDYIAAVSGTQMWSYNRKTNSATIANISADAIAFSKSTIDLLEWDNTTYSFVTTGEYGTSIFDLESGELIQVVPQDTVVGINTKLSITNAISAAWNEFLFTADGEAGVRVLKKTAKGPMSDKYYEIANVTFGTGISANDIEYHNKYLFVACGKGGVKVLYKSEDKLSKIDIEKEEDFYTFE